MFSLVQCPGEILVCIAMSSLHSFFLETTQLLHFYGKLPKPTERFHGPNLERLVFIRSLHKVVLFLVHHEMVAPSTEVTCTEPMLNNSVQGMYGQQILSRRLEIHCGTKPNISVSGHSHLLCAQDKTHVQDFTAFSLTVETCSPRRCSA